MSQKKKHTHLKTAINYYNIWLTCIHLQTLNFSRCLLKLCFLTQLGAHLGFISLEDEVWIYPNKVMKKSAHKKM